MRRIHRHAREVGFRSPTSKTTDRLVFIIDLILIAAILFVAVKYRVELWEQAKSGWSRAFFGD